MCWCHSLILNYTSKNLRHAWDSQPQNYQFQPTKVSFYNNTFIFICDRISRSLLSLLTHLDMHADKTITQTIFMVLFTSRSFLHLGKPLAALSGISPRYLSATNFPLTILSHYRYNPMGKFQFFSKDPSQWGEDYTDLWGHLDICPSLGQLDLVSVTFPELSSLYLSKGMGRCKETPQWYGLLVGFHQRWGNVRQSVWLLHHVGGSITGQGFHCGGSSQAIDHLGLQWTQLALCLGAAQWRHLPCATPQGGAPWHPDWGRHQ